MIPIWFNKANKVFTKPIDMTDEECGPLYAFIGQTEDGHPVVISCWEPTAEEIKEITETGKIWCFHYGTSLQPHALQSNSPFKPGN